MQDIHEVLDARAVTTLFQPLVEIATGLVVGYEALSRGPGGSPWESPAGLFAAARASGREQELDWICRASAYRAALGAAADARLTWFVNMEPSAARTTCPADLRPIVDQAQSSAVTGDRSSGRRGEPRLPGLRVVTEMTERAIAADPSGLLAATAACREAGWGVALDDVGADPMSLAVMPFVHPDVVKLDMQMLRAPGDPHTAQVVAAVAAYAEASGAVVLAEGIETAEHLAIARTMGATIGQGWYFGYPAPLPSAGPAVGELPFIPPPRHDDRTPFQIIGARRPLAVANKAQLLPMSRHLEALAGDGPEPPVLLACFQEARHMTPATRGRYARIAGRSPLVAAFGAGLDDEPAPGVRGAGLGAGDALRGEWNVIVVGPHHAAALVARDLGDTGPDRDRRFEFALTHDRGLVLEAARSLLAWLAPARAADQVVNDLAGQSAR